MRDTGREMEPLVCRPDRIPGAEREAHRRLTEGLLPEAEVVERLEDGYRYRFPVEAAEALERFARNERLCCSFLRIEIDRSPDWGAVWLTLTGPEGTHDVLERQLPQKRSL
jgi:hypothetical protein